VYPLLRRTFIMEDIEEIICIGRADNKAIYSDQDNDLAYIEDPNEIITVGDYCQNPETLTPLNALSVEEQENILNKLNA
jgi:hypothetical protein